MLQITILSIFIVDTDIRPSLHGSTVAYGHSTALFIDRLLQGTSEEASLFDEFSVLQPHDQQGISASYFDNIHPVFPFLIQAEFEETVKTLYVSQSFGTDIAFIVLYQAVLALGCQYHGCGSFDAGTGKAWKFFQTSLGYVPRLLLARESLKAVQAITALAIFAMNTSCLQVDHTLLAEATRMVLALRYHKSSVVDGSPMECHRVFWVVYHLEKQYNFQGRRASAIADCDVGCPVPEVHQSIFGEFNWLLASIRISRIFSIAYACLFSVDASTHQPEQLISAVDHVQKLLEDWRKSIPIDYRPGEPPTRPFPSQSALKEIALRTHFYYFHLLITSERLKLHLASNQGKIHESEKTLLKAAGSVIELTSQIDVEPYTPTFVLAIMPLAALFIVFDFVIHYPDNPETRQNLMLMDIVSGHFSLIERRSGGTQPGGYLSYFPYIARGYVESHERQISDQAIMSESRSTEDIQSLPAERSDTWVQNEIYNHVIEGRTATRSGSSIRNDSPAFEDYFTSDNLWRSSMQTATEADLGALFASVIDWEMGSALQIAGDENHQSGLKMAANVIGSIGVMALLLGMLELIAIVILRRDPIPKMMWTILHLTQYAVLILYIVGMSTSRNDLSQAASILVAVLFLVQTAICGMIEYQCRSCKSGRALTTICLISIPFLGVRVAYGLATMYVFSDSRFMTGVSGVVALAFLQYFMEFIVSTLFLYAGVALLPRTRAGDEERMSVELKENTGQNGYS
ncbi:fungal specific transcription factor domain-containing protein [Aspergillus affinis]|uniref:fungal specific transcription factor domain-containing protein n=1 Tax=Aspergillus affinis TaxID=1070780 RepID=UPI0022FE4501|nr:uncharacterized protein KD926_005672 [Aspergillus affinis]KAI9042376.1 hypothetical protein KD926_005672 [Aspergillus affinis]